MVFMDPYLKEVFPEPPLVAYTLQNVSTKFVNMHAQAATSDYEMQKLLLSALKKTY